MTKIRISAIDASISFDVLAFLIDFLNAHLVSVYTAKPAKDIERFKVSTGLLNLDVKSLESVDETADFPVDLVLVCDSEGSLYKQLVKNGVDRNKLVNLFLFSERFVGKTYNRYRYIRHVMNSQESFDVVLTGISYSNYGYSLEAASLKTAKIAYSGQDLFNDVNLSGFLFGKDSFRQVSAAIIGLAPYSFIYDMSLSVNGSGLNLFYYPLHKKWNNLRNAEKVEKVIGAKLCKFFEKGRPSADAPFDIYWNGEGPYNGVMAPASVVNARKIASRWAHKNYPSTIEQTRSLLTEYIFFLKERGWSLS